MSDLARNARLRVACALLAPPAPKGEGLRTPLEPAAALEAIRAMSEAERATLTGHVDWVLDYEAASG